MPESDAGRGRGMLRTSLVHLREVMDSFEAAYLIVERQTLGFDSTLDVDFDLHLLQEAVNTVERESDRQVDDQFMVPLQTEQCPVLMDREIRDKLNQNQNGDTNEYKTELHTRIQDRSGQTAAQQFVRYYRFYGHVVKGK